MSDNEPPAGKDRADLLVIGAGPGGYTAAFRAADLGRTVTLVDPRATLGGVCLNVGCIPSKALLHMARLREEAVDAARHGAGVNVAAPDIDKIRAWKDGVVGRLTHGLDALAKRRKINVVHGLARFIGPNSAEIVTGEDVRTLGFDQAILATGSEPVRLPFLPDDPRIIDSTGALALEGVPGKLLVIGGGVIGLEMAQVYHALGAQVEVVELAGQILPGVDADVVAPLAKRIGARYRAVRTSTKVAKIEAGGSLRATFEGPDGVHGGEYDRILVAVGRRPNTASVEPAAAGIAMDASGFIRVDEQMRTSQPHIFAIGDVVGQPMLAHKATHQGKVAAEGACGQRVAFEAKCIPSVAYTDPEVAWVGLSETKATGKGINCRKAVFPWAASGRALSIGRSEGLTKILFDPDRGHVLGAGITGPNAGDLIAEVALAIEMAATAEDLALTVHPHPTLSETLPLAAEVFAGTITDL